MYYITGADGKVYGPVGLDIIQKWIGEGRVNSQTKLRIEGSEEWKSAAEISEIDHLFQRPSSPPPVGGIPPQPPGSTNPPNNGLAVASLVLGILSFVACLGPLTGIPALICGHIARNRAQRMPATYGGGGMALAGLIMGYISLLMLLVLPAILLPALARAKDRAQSINCVNNMKQIGLAFKVWGIDHEDQFPFNTSTNQGGTMEFSSQGQNGVDPKGYLHLMVLSNELSVPKILVCPSDKKKTANDWSELSAANVSYEIMSGTNITDANPSAVLGMCPVHGHVLTTDGAVQQFRKSGKSKRR